MARLRGQVYRDDLGHLDDEVWLHAVSVARRKRWFPSIEELLEYAATTPRQQRALPPPTPEWERNRQAMLARAGLRLTDGGVERIAPAAAIPAAVPALPAVVASMPPARSGPVVVTDERLAELRRGGA